MAFSSSLQDLPVFVVHPVPYDMCVEIGLPCGIVAGYSIMSLVTVDEHLQGCDTPTLLTHLAEVPQLFHRGVVLDDNHALLERECCHGTMVTLPVFLVHPFPVFGLHRPTCLFLDHCGYLIVAVGERGFAEIR